MGNFRKTQILDYSGRPSPNLKLEDLGLFVSNSFKKKKKNKE